MVYWAQCSKLTTSLVNELLKFRKYKSTAFCRQNMRNVSSAKVPHTFSAKNMSPLDFMRTRRLKGGLPYLFHSFRNKYLNKISLGNLLYF